MAAVQDLVRWLKSRRSQAKTKRKGGKEAEQTSPASPAPLSSREGVALPLTPLPGYLNLPDISRDCVRTPCNYYDEIPAYAIDTRMDILRETQVSMDKLDMRQAEQFGPYLVVPLQDRHRTDPAFDQPAGPASRRDIPRQNTPWQQHHHDQTEPDQLDQWVPVPENQNSLDEHQRSWYSAHHHHHHNNPEFFANHPRRDFHSSMPHVDRYPQQPETSHHHRHHLVQYDPTTAFPSSAGPEKPLDSWSDDSGVSSPSMTSVPQDDTESWRSSLPHRTQQPTQAPTTQRWHDSTAAGHWHDSSPNPIRRVVPEHCHQDSSDSHNEYDADTLTRHQHQHKEGSMSPEEYSFYLSKIKSNLQRTCGIKTRIKTPFQRNPSPTVSENSLDLTTHADEEVSRLTAAVASCHIHKATSKSAPSEPRRRPDDDTPETSSAQSAFKPYPSQRRHSCSVPAKAERTVGSLPTPQPLPVSVPTPPAPAMNLEDRLSCRATTLKPSEIRRRVPNTAASQGSKRRPSSGIIPSSSSSGASSSSASQNKLLSDIMRINHDRQILVLI